MDDKPFYPVTRGWVSVFVESLQGFLAQKLGRDGDFLGVVMEELENAGQGGGTLGIHTALREAVRVPGGFESLVVKIFSPISRLAVWSVEYMPVVRRRWTPAGSCVRASRVQGASR